jgi:type II secretory pathway component PulF
VFVLPKLKDICAASGIHIPPLITFALDLSDLFKNNFFIAATAICLTLTLLEWRCNWWRRYRRLAFGIGVFLMNSAVFILITMMIVLAVGAATYALHHAK